jgi:hypothetical protein
MSEVESCSAKQLEDTLVAVVIEGWRLSRLFTRALNKMDAGEAGRYSNQLRFFQKRLEESLLQAKLKIVNIEGQVFDEGMPATALNMGDFGPDDELLIDQMLEPIIMWEGGVRKAGTVMLRKVST